MVPRSWRTPGPIPLADGNTAAKLVDYLGPLIKARREHSEDLKMTPEVAYRWCGEHAPYILSWCRRNGYGDIATRITATPGS